MLDWARWCRRALVAAGVVALVMGGVSIFGQPEREILYQPEPPLTVCGEHGCTFIYRLEVGNSGAEPQDEVIVRLRRDVVEAAILPVKARNYGKIERRSASGTRETFAPTRSDGSSPRRESSSDSSSEEPRAMASCRGRGSWRGWRRPARA